MRRLLAALVIGCALLIPSTSFAEQLYAIEADDLSTDANIVTGLDVSSSMDPREAQIQIEGMAMAIQAPEIVSAIESGRYKRIGFFVFLWAENAVPVFASWKVIGSSQDARQAADELVTNVRAILRSAPQQFGSLTDVSAAMEYAAGMLRTAPSKADRAVVNIVGDGVDNVGEGPQKMRDELVAGDITINGIVIGGDPIVFQYFRRNVIGGPTAFVLAVEDRQKLVEVFARKFVTEIVLNIEQTNHDHR